MGRKKGPALANVTFHVWGKDDTLERFIRDSRALVSTPKTEWFRVERGEHGGPGRIDFLCSGCVAKQELPPASSARCHVHPELFRLNGLAAANLRSA